MEGILPIIITGLAILIFQVCMYFLIIKMFYKKVRTAKAIVRNGLGGTKVATSKGIYIIPSFHTYEILDLSSKSIRVKLLDDNNLITRDDLRIDIKASFMMRIKYELEQIKRVSETIGATNASNSEHLKELFSSKFIEALKTVARKYEFKELLDSRSAFRDNVIDIIGTDLYGFILEDCAIDYIEKQ
ncbi:MAG: SPFH domain-containing protein [Nonlabens sp.]|uniref:SPFH domain-containing protein n=1 Tax=Nonlabens sp. TaxID=1888209 RepID=UPI003EF6335F